MAKGLPFYAPNTGSKHLNIDALTQAQLEAAALEAGAPLADILPSKFETPVDDAGNVDVQPQPLLTHMQIGGMVSLLGQFAVSFTHSHVNVDTQYATNHVGTEDAIVDDRPVQEKLGVPFTRTLTIPDQESFLETLKSEERSAFITRQTLAWLFFIVFWVVCTLP
jgi:potassium channel subfamily K